MGFKLGYVLIYLSFAIVRCKKLSYTQIVTINNNKSVIGFYEKNVLHGKQFSSFLGIPYAEPPLNDRRFLPPLEYNWKNRNGIFYAVKFGNKCPQRCDDGSVCGKEDCLFLNVHTPITNFTKKLASPKAVMVWIHGGAFVKGYGDKYKPDYLVDKDVILVTFNYRLGLLGFLNLGHELVPGNAGLKDQNMALKWVKKNIAKFGGDPNRITIFGQSAGAASVDLHNIAKMSRGLYARSIAMSGSVFCPWAFSTSKNAKNSAIDFIEDLPDSDLDYDYDSVDDFITSLKDENMENLITTAADAFWTSVLDGKFGFPALPSVETVKYKNNEKFIDVCYFKRFREKDSIHSGEHMMGFTSLESYLFNDMSAYNRVGSFAKWVLTYLNAKELLKPVAVKIFDAQIDLKQKYMLQYGNPKAVYYYYFKYLSKTNQIEGVAHSEDLQYVFYQKDRPHLNNKSRDSVTRERFVSLLTNFAKTGNPNYNELNQKIDRANFYWNKSTKEGGFLKIANDISMRNKARPISENAIKLQNKIERRFDNDVCVLDLVKLVMDN